MTEFQDMYKSDSKLKEMRSCVVQRGYKSDKILQCNKAYVQN